MQQDHFDVSHRSAAAKVGDRKSDMTTHRVRNDREEISEASKEPDRAHGKAAFFKRPPEILPSLPKFEILLCFLIWFGHSIYAYYLVYTESRNATNANRIWHHYLGDGWSLLAPRKRDTSDYEWDTFLHFLPNEILLFLIHCIFLRTAEYFISNERILRTVLTIFWLLLLWIKLHWIGVVATVIHGFLMLLTAHIFRSKFMNWICACALLATLATDWYSYYDHKGENSGDLEYRFVVYIAYKLLHYITFCDYYLEAEKIKKPDHISKFSSAHFWRAFAEQMHYTLYPPYSYVLIVPYKQFSEQWRTRKCVSVDYKNLTSIIIRVTFWTFFNDFFLHFFYNSAIMHDSYLLNQTDLATLCAIGYVSGQFFHTKYVSIFGLNTIFALADGMKPYDFPPICISRVALYSYMWRYFDRGLYAFLRDYLFLPIASPTFSFLRRTLATAVCFAFVWLWHGTTWSFVFWVTLNFLEICLENMAKEIYAIPPISAFVTSKISPTNRRRLASILHTVCVTLGILSIFYFLGGTDTGHVYVNRVLYQEGLNLRFSFFYLLALGYCYTQCCMEIDQWKKKSGAKN